MQQQRKTIEWIYSSDRGPGTKTTPIWRVQALLDGQCIAEGRGSTKKAAQNDAAKAGLEGLNVEIVRVLLPHYRINSIHTNLIPQNEHLPRA